MPDTHAPVIRRAVEADCPRIAALWEEMMRFHLSFDPRFAIAVDGVERYQEYLIEMLRNVDHRVLVAEAPPSRVIAYAIGIILANPPVFQLPYYGYIAEMSVEQALRGRGIGRALWNELIAWFASRGINVVQLNVSSYNETGQRFWRSLGCRDFLDVVWYDIPPS